MIRFGLIQLGEPEAIFRARTKTRRVAIELGMDDLASTRLSTAVSQAVRWTQRHDSEGVLELGLTTSGAQHDLTLSITTRVPIPEPDFLRPFVDSVSQSGTTITARVRHAEAPVDDSSVARARAIINEQSRDELLVEVRASNEALEASKDALEQTVRERTGELKLALEQVENSETIIERWSPDGTITAMNTFGLRLFRYEEDEIVGKNAFDTIVPADEVVRQAWVASAESLFASTEQHAESELQCCTKNGDALWIAFRSRAISDAGGAITEILSIGIDVTERR